jgi:hypothetical protein
LISAEDSGLKSSRLEMPHAVSNVDRHGNLVRVYSVPCVTQGKSSDQRQDPMRLAAKAVVA